MTAQKSELVTRDWLISLRPDAQGYPEIEPEIDCHDWFIFDFGIGEHIHIHYGDGVFALIQIGSSTSHRINSPQLTLRSGVLRFLSFFIKTGQ